VFLGLAHACFAGGVSLADGADPHVFGGVVAGCRDAATLLSFPRPCCPMLSNLRDGVVGSTASPKIARHYMTLQGRRLHENEADDRSCRRRFSFARLRLLADPSRASAGAVEDNFWYSVRDSTSAVSLLRAEVCQAGIVLDSHELTSDRAVP